MIRISRVKLTQNIILKSRRYTEAGVITKVNFHGWEKVFLNEHSIDICNVIKGINSISKKLNNVIKYEHENPSHLKKR